MSFINVLEQILWLHKCYCRPQRWCAHRIWSINRHCVVPPNDCPIQRHEPKVCAPYLCVDKQDIHLHPSSSWIETCMDIIFCICLLPCMGHLEMQLHMDHGSCIWQLSRGSSHLFLDSKV
jgi:hypothetical protein